MLWECKHFLPAGQKVMLKMSLVAQLIAEVRDLNLTTEATETL